MKKYLPLLFLGLVFQLSCGTAEAGKESENAGFIGDIAEGLGDASGEMVAKEAEEEESASSNFESEFDNLPKMKAEPVLKQLHASREKAKNAELAYFESSELKSWISQLGTSEDEDGMPLYETLDDARFGSLDAKGLVYYYLAHPDEWDQVCAESLVEGGDVQAIMVHIPYDMSGDYHSDRQISAINQNLDEIEGLVLDCIRPNQNVSIDMLRFISNFHLKSAVPILVDKYKQQADPKDDLILSCLVEMMTEAEFGPWMNCDLKKNAGEAYYESFELSTVVADKILFYAQKYGRE